MTKAVVLTKTAAMNGPRADPSAHAGHMSETAINTQPDSVKARPCSAGNRQALRSANVPIAAAVITNSPDMSGALSSICPP